MEYSPLFSPPSKSVNNVINADLEVILWIDQVHCFSTNPNPTRPFIGASILIKAEREKCTVPRLAIILRHVILRNGFFLSLSYLYLMNHLEKRFLVLSLNIIRAFDWIKCLCLEGRKSPSCLTNLGPISSFSTSSKPEFPLYVKQSKANRKKQIL